MHTNTDINSKRAPKLRRTVRAVRSGFRRYPRAIYQSLAQTQSEHHQIHIPELLTTMAPHDLAVLWLGHGSLVAQVANLTIALDPVLSQRIGMRLKGRTIGIERLTPPPIAAESLLGTNLVLITHAHFDHLDKPTLERMRSPKTTLITPKNCSKLIPEGFGQVVELGPNHSFTLEGVRITAIEPKHWGARALFDRKRGVNSYLVESENQRVLFTGDTAETKVYEGLDPIDLAVFGIGAYDPWDHMHATPEQAWTMFKGLDARYMLPIHHSTFDLSEEPIDEPIQRLYQFAGTESNSIINPILGEIVVINSPPPPQSPSQSDDRSAPD